MAHEGRRALKLKSAALPRSLLERRGKTRANEKDGEAKCTRLHSQLSLETGTTGEMGPKARVCDRGGGAASWELGAQSERPERQRDLEVLENVGAFRPPACRRQPKLAGQPGASITDEPSRAEPSRPSTRPSRSRDSRTLRAATAASSDSPTLQTPKPRNRTSPSRGSESGGAFLFFLLPILKPKQSCAPLWALHPQRRVQAPPGCG